MKDLIQKRFKGKRILFASFPPEGQISPLTFLAKYLKGLGCDVRWYASQLFEDQIRDFQIPFYPFEHALDIDNLYQSASERNILLEASEKPDADMNNFFAKRSMDYLQDLEDIHQSFPFDMMIADSMFTAIPLVRDELPVQVISVGVIPLTPAHFSNAEKPVPPNLGI